MKQLFTSLLLLTSSVAFSAQDLTITVTNIREAKGNIIIGIFDNEHSFPENGHELKQLIIPVETEQATTTIHDLPDGEYAVAIFHDANKNNTCDRNMLGIPREGFGFSTNFKPTLKAPSFDNVKFKKEGNVSMSIKLIYW